jgi:hypothetical protein
MAASEVIAVTVLPIVSEAFVSEAFVSEANVLTLLIVLAALA